MHREMIKLMKKSNTEMKLSFIDLKTKSLRDHKNNENKINEISQKLSDINIFELFKGDNAHNENDKELLNSLEQKLTERMDSLEEKNKLNDDSIYRLKKDFVNLKNLTENISRLTSNNQENYLNLTKDIDSKIKALNTKIDEEVNKVKDISNNNYNENKNEILKKYNELNNKISNLTDDFKSFNDKINSINQLLLGNDKINELNNDIKNYINKSISDTETYLKSIINNLDIDDIKNSISKIQEELNQNKLLKNDIDLINNKISDSIEKKLAELDQKVDAQSTDINMCNDTCNKTVKMVEYLSGQVIETYQPDLDKDGKIGNLNYNNLIKQNVDMTSFMTKELFIEERNKIIKKI
jgi:DNA repair exonuclease SbcCD ATPase subunit